VWRKRFDRLCADETEETKKFSRRKMNVEKEEREVEQG
jgi:hypothetical protein